MPTEKCNILGPLTHRCLAVHIKATSAYSSTVAYLYTHFKTPGADTIKYLEWFM